MKKDLFSAFLVPSSTGVRKKRRIFAEPLKRKNIQPMKSLVNLLLLLCLTASCTQECNIAGNSSVGSLDGRMLYLRVSSGAGTQTVCIDSCEVIHGRFKFYSNLDSAVMAQLFMGDQMFMPLVLESGNLSIQVDHVEQTVSGSPYNDRLYKFVQQKNRIENKLWELDRKCMRMMHDGHSPEVIRRAVMPKSDKLTRQMEALETNFIKDNYDNPLGPGCFRLLFSQYPLPIMTDQIRDIMRGAPASFLKDPYVDYYLRRARLNSSRPDQP